jgi:hypothetical protein
MGPIGCSETSVQYYHSTLRNVSGERRSHLIRGGSLKSRFSFCVFGLSVWSERDTGCYICLSVCLSVCLHVSYLKPQNSFRLSTKDGRVSFSVPVITVLTLRELLRTCHHGPHFTWPSPYLSSRSSLYVSFSVPVITAFTLRELLHTCHHGPHFTWGCSRPSQSTRNNYLQAYDIKYSSPDLNVTVRVVWAQWVRNEVRQSSLAYVCLSCHFVVFMYIHRWQLYARNCHLQDKYVTNYLFQRANEVGDRGTKGIKKGTTMGKRWTKQKNNFSLNFNLPFPLGKGHPMTCLCRHKGEEEI